MVHPRQSRRFPLKSLAIFLVFSFGIRLQAQESQEREVVAAATVEATSDTGTIQGSVVAAPASEPLRGAHVTLIEVSGGRLQTFSAATDSEGHFLITQVPAGRYRAKADRNGYVSQVYRPRGDASGRILELSAGQKIENVQFSLKRAAVILGHINDENGEPMPGVTVEAMIAKGRLHDFQSNIATAIPIKTAITNDLGEYRLYGLPAGSFYVVAIESGGPQFDAMLGGWTSFKPVAGAAGGSGTKRPPLYYPGVTQLSQAQEIRLVAGQEAHADFSLMLEKAVKVSGWVVNSIDMPAAQAMVSLRAQGIEGMMSFEIPATTDAQGKFEIKDITPGSYALSAVSYQGGISYSAAQTIEVARENVSRVRLQLYPGVNITGKLTVSGNTNVDLSRMVALLSNGDGEFVSEIKDGRLSFQDVRHGAYTLELINVPDGWYVSSVVFGSDNVLESGLKIGEGSSRYGVEITLRHGTTTIEGAVMQGDDPVPDAVVHLIPEAVNPYRSRLERVARTDQHGYFALANVVPGRYRAVAVRGETNDDDSVPLPDGSVGEKVAVAEGESKNVQLKLTVPEP